MVKMFIIAKLHRVAIGWFLGACLVLTLLNLPKDRVRVFASRSHAGSTLRIPGESSRPAREWLGRSYGWPYSQTLNAASESDSLSSFGLMLLNISVALAISLIVAAFAVGAYWVHKQIYRPASRTRKMAMISVAIICVAFPVLVVNNHIATAKALPRELENYGLVEYAIESPAFIAQRVPASLLHPFMQAKGVRLVQPPVELLERAAQELSLHSVTISNSTIDGPLWLKFVEGQDLHSLHLSDCELIDFGNSVPTCPALQSLTLTSCKGVDEVIAALRQLSKLHTIDFEKSPANISAICRSLPAELKDLRLCLENTGSDSLQFHDLPHLESLTLIPSGRTSSGNPLAIDLCNLNRLSHLTLSSSQVFDLTAIGVPRLASIMPIATRTAAGPNGSQTFDLSIRNLVINEAPALLGIRLGMEPLQSLVLKNTPNLRKLSIVQSERETKVPTEPDNSRTPPTHDWHSKINRLVADIAKCDGPTSLDLTGQPLHNVDLSPIGQNSRIRELILFGTGVRASQLTRIDHENRIKSLNLVNCKIKGDEVQALLDSYPGVERLLVDTDHHASLDVVDLPKLNYLFGSASQAAQRVRIVGCPNLTGDLSLGGNLETLELRDAASLTALSIGGPFPANTVIEGLRDLEVAELIGVNVREEHFAALLQCKSMRELTLAVPSLAAATLQKIGQFEDLAVLNVPGAQIDDDVVASWGSLRHLQEVNLSHTNVTGKSLQVLARNPSLRRLNLSHTKIQPEDLEAISQMKNLFEIDLTGIGITPTALRQFLRSHMADNIDLSGSIISQELLDVLASEDARCLRFIGLRHCRLQDNDVLRIELTNPGLAMDLEGNHLCRSVLDDLAAQGRLVSRDDVQGMANWNQRLDGALAVLNRPGFDGSKREPINRRFGKQFGALGTTALSHRAVRAALRFTWERQLADVR